MVAESGIEPDLAVPLDYETSIHPEDVPATEIVFTLANQALEMPSLRWVANLRAYWLNPEDSARQLHQLRLRNHGITLTQPI